MSNLKSKKCDLCPRGCAVYREKGETGFCGCGRNVRVGRIAPHFWEEPCICTEGGSGAVFFCGCNLKCLYCQNREIAFDGGCGLELTVDELADEYLRLQAMGVCNINLVTPTPWVEQIRESLDLSWQRGLWLPVVYNCGGYESVSAVRSLRGYVSVYLADFKYSDSGLARRFSSAPDYPERAIEAIGQMIENVGEPVFDGDVLKKGVIVRHLILPGYTGNSVRCVEMLRETFGDSIVYSIMNQFTPVCHLPGVPDRTVTGEEYRSVLACAGDVRFLYIQEGGTAAQSFIPEWDLKNPAERGKITSF